MADAKISALTTASALTGVELVEVVQGGANRRTTIGATRGVLLDMPIVVGSVAATPSWGRRNGDLPAAPVGASLVDIVADPAMASRSCLRVGATAAEGLWLYAIQGITLPADGWVLEVDIADLPDVAVSLSRAAIGLMYDDYDEGGASLTPRGLVCYLYRGAANTVLSAWGLVSTDYTTENVAPFDFDAAWLRDQAAIDRGGVVLRFECRRAAAITPAEWLIRCEVRDVSGTVYFASATGVSAPIAELDGRALASIGLGGYTDTSGGPAGDSWISVRRVRVMSL